MGESEGTVAVFPHADIELSRLGFGLGSLMRVPSTRDRRRLLESAFDAGIRHFDVARMYGLGAAESELGRFARTRTDEITVATKFGIDVRPAIAKVARFQGPARRLLNAAPALRRRLRSGRGEERTSRVYDGSRARRSLETSLRELGLDHVDILFVHDPGPMDEIRFAELRETFEALRVEGKIRAWGAAQDAHPELPVVRELGPRAILQIRDDILSPAPLHGEAEPIITFGVLRSVLGSVLADLRNPPILSRWRQRLDLDPLQPETLAGLLLADALARNERGTVLFNTTRPERNRIAAAVLAGPPPPATLAAFRELAANEDGAATR